MPAILHVDMDAFYASVEQRDDPRLRGRPVIVGGPSKRGVVSAASYEARPFGVHSAMPLVQAVRLCPQAVVVPVRMSRYREVSDQVFEIFHRFTPLVEGLSLDEAFLDVTASRALFGDGVAIARSIKEAIRGELDLVASAGVASCKFVAKIASDLEKPDGLTVVDEPNVTRFLAPLPIERMWGVGPKAASRLRAAGIATLGDLATAPVSRLEALLGSWGVRARELASGHDLRSVDPHREAQSIGAEVTHERDLTSAEDIRRALLEHAGRVAQRLLEAGLSARCVTVKLKDSRFQLRSRRVLLPEPVADTGSIYRAATGLLLAFPPSTIGVRLTGVSLSHLELGPPPPGLFPDEAKRKRARLEGVIADVGSRLGVSLTRAALLDPAGPKRE